jgi:AraC family transcriptional regulator, melibiose operon regulatory protein
MPAAHAHTDIEFNYVLNGELRYFFGGRFEIVGPIRLTMFWAGIPHQLVQAAPQTEMVWVTVPLAWFMQWKISESFRQRLLTGEMFRQSTTPASVTGWVEDFATGHRELREIVLLEIEACVRRIGVGEPAPTKRTGGGDAIEKVTRVIGERYAEELTVADIAGAVKLHPNYLMRLFKQRCGMSLWEYVTRLRVSHAQRLLITTDRKVVDVALESGFGSVSRFHAAFRRVAGQTPRAYRAALA